MTDSWLAVGGWLGHAALVGAAVLLLGLVGARVVRGPARRQWLAVWAIRAAVLAPALCLLPAWLTVPAPVFVSEELRAASIEPEPTANEPAERPLPAPDRTEVISTEPAWEWAADLIFEPMAGAERPPEVAGPEPAPVASPTPVAPDAPPPPVPSSLAAALPLVVSAYGLVAAVFLGQMLLGHVGLVRLVRSARPATYRVQALFDELTAGMRRRPRLLVSDRVASPVCFGVWRPTVLLPTALARSSAEAQLRWIFAHELDHVRRGDLSTGLWVGLARAAYFFVPWFWVLRRELSLSQEYLADAAAAAADGRAVDYAAFLVDLSGGPARVPRMAHAVRAGGSDLYRRVTMLLKSGAGVDRRCPRGWAALAAGGVLSAAILLSGLGLVSAQDEKPQPPDKPAQQDKADKDKTKPDGDRDVAAIKKAIAEAARKGDVDEIRRQTARLERAMSGRRDGDRRPDRPRDGERPRDPNKLREPAPPRPPAPPAPPNFPGDPFRFNTPNADQMRDAMKQAEKALREAMENLKDNPEARQQMQRALEQYHKAMEQGMKRAADARDRLRDFRKANPDAPFPGFERFGDEFGRGGFGGGFGPGGGGFGFRPGSPRFGVMVSPVTEALAEQLDLPTDRGVVVVQVLPGSAAEKAGVKKNDVILSFAGQDIGGNVSKFAGAVEKAKPGQKVNAVVLRKGKKETLKGIELPEAPKRERRPGGGFGPPGFAPGKGSVESVKVQITTDDFTIDATKDGTPYHLAGKIEDGKAAPSQIVVGSGDKKESYKSLQDVPEEHRAVVKELLGSVRGGR